MSMYSGEELMCKDHGGKGCGSVLECLLMIRKTQVTEQMWSSKLRWHWGQEHKRPPVKGGLLGWCVSGKVQELLCLEIRAGRTGLAEPQTKGGRESLRQDRDLYKPGQPVTAAIVIMCALGNVHMRQYTCVCTSLCS